MSGVDKEQEADIVKFPGIASISLSITPLGTFESFDMLEAIVRVYDDNDEQIMRQKARSLFTIAKNLKLFIQIRTNLPINDRRMSTWFAEYLTGQGIKLDAEEAYKIIKEASQALDKISRVKIEEVEPTDLVSIETDVLAKLIPLKMDHLFTEEELDDLLEKHQTPVCSQAHRSLKYVNSGGVEHADKIQLPIDSVREKLFEHKLQSSFKNESEKELTNIVIEDIIPYCFRIESVTCDKCGDYSKELLDEGLKLQWNIPSLAPGEEILFDYQFEKRIPRTILIRKGEDIRIVQDYNSLITEIDEDTNTTRKYFISEVINLLPVTLDELIVRDLIPNELRLATNSETEDLRIVDFGLDVGINHQWSQMNVETGTKLLREFTIKAAPLLWKYNLSVPVEGEAEIALTKIVESTSDPNIHVCTLVATTPVSITVENELESGLQATEFSPSDVEPSISGSTMKWDITNRLTVSMVLKGTLSRHPTPPSIVLEGTKHTAKTGNGEERTTQLLSVPFTHVALFRRISRT